MMPRTAATPVDSSVRKRKQPTAVDFKPKTHDTPPPACASHCSLPQCCLTAAALVFTCATDTATSQVNEPVRLQGLMRVTAAARIHRMVAKRHVCWLQILSRWKGAGAVRAAQQLVAREVSTSSRVTLGSWGCAPSGREVRSGNASGCGGERSLPHPHALAFSA